MGLRLWAKPLRFSHICMIYFLMKKAVVFQTFTAFSYIKIAIFFEVNGYFVGEKLLLFSIELNLLRIAGHLYRIV
jgi:hypothetical protein